MIHPAPTIIAAIDAARAATGWTDGAAIADMAAHLLAGRDADAATIADAAQQISTFLASQIEGAP